MSYNTKKITVELSLEIMNILQDTKDKHRLTNQSQAINKVFEEFIWLDDDLKNKVGMICKAKDTTYNDMIINLIKKGIDKELKGYGFVKEKHKKTATAEAQLLEVLHAAVDYYDRLPDMKDKVYLSPSAIHKFILMKDYKQKNMGVIKRFLATPETEFIREYHERNNLKPKRQGYNAS